MTSRLFVIRIKLDVNKESKLELKTRKELAKLKKASRSGRVVHSKAWPTETVTEEAPLKFHSSINVYDVVKTTNTTFQVKFNAPPKTLH